MDSSAGQGTHIERGEMRLKFLALSLSLSGDISLSQLQLGTRNQEVLSQSHMPGLEGDIPITSLGIPTGP